MFTFDPKASFEAAGSAMTLLDTLIKTTEKLRSDGHEPSLATVLATMPGEAYRLSEQLEEEAKDLRKRLVAAGIDPKTPVNKLETSCLWWAGEQGRALHKFKPRVNAILAELETFMDDIVAVAHCLGKDELIAASYEKALERKRALQKELDYDRPINEIVDVVIRYSQELHAEAGKLLH
ncbi:MAG: hypothetical protein WBV36_04145 [Terriglobales bacterium]